jgi:hypothetical protein
MRFIQTKNWTYPIASYLPIALCRILDGNSFIVQYFYNASTPPIHLQPIERPESKKHANVMLFQLRHGRPFCLKVERTRMRCGTANTFWGHSRSFRLRGNEVQQDITHPDKTKRKISFWSCGGTGLIFYLIIIGQYREEKTVIVL